MPCHGSSYARNAVIGPADSQATLCNATDDSTGVMWHVLRPGSRLSSFAGYLEKLRNLKSSHMKGVALESTAHREFLQN